MFFLFFVSEFLQRLYTVLRITEEPSICLRCFFSLHIGRLCRCLFCLTVTLLLTLLDHSCFFGSKVQEHLLAFERGHRLYLTVLFQIIGKTEKENLTLFLEKNGASAEEHIRTNLVAIEEELLCVLQLELIVVLIGLRTEPNLLYLNFNLLLLHFLLPLLLLVKELGIVDQATNWRLGIGGDFYKVNSLLASQIQSLSCGHYL